MITENRDVYVGEADDTNEFGVRIQTASTDMHVTVETARAFAQEILDAAQRAEENDQEEARERAEQQTPLELDRIAADEIRRMFPLHRPKGEA